MKIRYSLVLLIGLLPLAVKTLVAASAGSALGEQTGLIVGRVSNAATTNSLEGALVRVENTAYSAQTGRDGSYRLQVPAGSYTLKVSYTGLDEQSVPVTVQTGGSVTQDIALTANIYRLSAVTVSGEREGNAQAITLQRLSTGVRSIASADAFGGLAGNPADLAARLPGVEGVLVGGDVRFVRIRGLSQQLTTITQDGNRVADAASGGTTREYHFQTISADSMERMEVIKSPTPDMDGDSIGGAVNMVSKSAFDSSPERRIRASFGAIWRALEPRDKARPNYSLSYSEVFGAKLGVSINLAYRPHGSIYDISSIDFGPPAATVGAPEYMNFLQVIDFHNIRTRAGSGLKLDYKLNDAVRVFANWQYNKHIEHGDDTTATFSTGAAVATVDASGNYTGTGGVLPGFTERVTQVRAVPSSQVSVKSGNAYKDGTTSTITVGASHRHGSVNLEYDLYSSKSKANYAGNNSLTYTLANVGFTFDRADPEFPTVVQTAGPDWMNLANYTSNTYQTRRMVGWDEYMGAQFNAKKDFATVVPTFIKAGVRLRDQTRRVGNTTMNYRYVGPDGVMGPNPATGINDDNLAQFGLFNRPFPDTKLKRYPNLPFPMKQAAGTEFDILTRPQNLFQENTVASNLQNDLVSHQRFEENIHAYFVMGSVDLGKITVLGGVRVENTETEGEGSLQLVTPEEAARRAAYVGTPTNDEIRRRTQEEFGRRQIRKGEYRTVFPGLHFKYSPVRQLVTRLSYATNIGRPSIGQLIPRTNVNFDNRTISTSNPSLKPQFANNFDISAEYYFEPAGQFAVGLFLKEIKDFIYTTSTTVGAGADNGFNGDYAGYALSTQFNGGFGKVKGVEVSYSQQFTFLPGFWSGFGAFANLTRLQAEGNYGAGNAISLTPAARVAGFNPFVANMGVSYIKDRVSLRVSMNYRDKYLTGLSANEARSRYESARTLVDIKTMYNISKNFDVYLDVVNVTAVPETISEYGYGRITGSSLATQQFFFGINARL